MIHVVLFLGPPGSGKGTQADFIAAEFPRFVHFDTGHEIEKVLTDPKKKDDPEIQMEYEKFRKGLLADTPWTIRIVEDAVRRIAANGQSIIFSGSPRSRQEAEMLIPFLREVYGEASILALHILASEETSIFRNTRRRVCKECALPLMWSEENEKLAFCPRCGGELMTRVLDTEETIRQRLIEYRHVTESILPFFVALGIPVYEVNGEQPPEKVTQDIIASVGNLLS